MNYRSKDFSLPAKAHREAKVTGNSKDIQLLSLTDFCASHFFKNRAYLIRWLPGQWLGHDHDMLYYTWVSRCFSIGWADVGGWIEDVRDEKKDVCLPPATSGHWLIYFLRTHSPVLLLVERGRRCNDKGEYFKIHSEKWTQSNTQKEKEKNKKKRRKYTGSLSGYVTWPKELEDKFVFKRQISNESDLILGPFWQHTSNISSSHPLLHMDMQVGGTGDQTTDLIITGLFKLHMYHHLLSFLIQHLIHSFQLTHESVYLIMAFSGYLLLPH